VWKEEDMPPKQKGHFKPSREEKGGGLEHVRYEIERACEYGSQKPWQGLYWPLGSYKTALFESFVLHVRSLLGFFETEVEKRRCRDILACDYGFKVGEVCAKIDKQDLDRYLAHLTYWRLERPEDPEIAWQKFSHSIVPPFRDRCIEFVTFIIGGGHSDFALLEDERTKWKELNISLDEWRRQSLQEI
jgi:hypothetical protein